ncbi:sulfatase-like hydrolase/transferase [Coraliomargarita sp. SDUM461004]|uniref:Sulfatase-like hydrolase/transferase n=1 Tax=Thalassobacterium sedimentorum TaxID=3041258 RepID=A0ABU1AK47_9BACT|nr:sulfatase-like hydrolase/transferase [Coraliomargarita sp. SDUM461004]MDQ8194106.1 sulfatase-like hydrolase/transferase [Coraliomargarita sp. SDUM461004]
MKPNIIVFLTDQQRWDSCGCYGQQLPVTPELDRMAQHGTCFSHAFSPQPLCTPARSCLQTGRYASETGVFMLDIALPTDEKTIAHRMSEVGYDTGYIGKWHLAATNLRYADPKKRPGQQEPFECFVDPIPEDRRGGYDYWLASNHLESTTQGYGGHLFDGEGKRREFPEGRFRVDAMTDWALEYLDSRTEEKPFFLFLSFIEPHWQNNRKAHDSPYGMAEQFEGAEIPGDLKDYQGQPAWLIPNWRDEYSHYLACCHSLDQNLVRIRSKLSEMGVADNTVLAFTSDHGCHFGKHNTGAKDSCHDASIRVPLVIDGPGFTGGGKNGHMASLIDLPPTLMRAAGIEIPDTMRGRPLQEAVDVNADAWRDEVFYQISPSILGRGIRNKQWKFSVKAPDKDGWDEVSSPVYVDEFLFDLERDPHELNNLVDDPDYESVRVQLRARLVERIVEAGEPRPEITSSLVEA